MAAVVDAPAASEVSPFASKYKVVNTDEEAIAFADERQGPQTPLYDTCQLFLCCHVVGVSGGGLQRGAFPRSRARRPCPPTAHAASATALHSLRGRMTARLRSSTRSWAPGTIGEWAVGG